MSKEGSVVFAAGDKDITVTVQLIVDSVHESTEYFDLVTTSEDWTGVSVFGRGSISELEPRLIVNPTELEVHEGDASGERFNVRLATRPSSEVTVTVTRQTDTELPNSRDTPSTTLTFTTNDWDIDQPVWVIAGEDDNTVNEQITFALAASGGGYGGVSGRSAGNGDRQRQAGAGGKSDGDGR